MPTVPGIPSQPLDPKQTAAKLEGLISEITSPDDEPEERSTEAAPSDAPTPPSDEDTEPTVADETAQPELYEVKVDGSAVKVDLDELKAGYSRQEDYSRKARALADERRAHETEAQQVQQDRERYAQGLKQLTDALQSIQGEPDWEAERKNLTPEDFLKKRADWTLSQANLEKLQRHQQDEARQSDESRLAQWQKYLRAEQDKLKAAIPEWEDTAKAKAETEQLVTVAKHYGFSEQEVRGVTDHRAILLLRDAMKYRELHREPNPQRPKISPIKTAKPGTPDRPRPNEKQTQLVERAAKSGRGRDAAAAIEAMLKD